MYPPDHGLPLIQLKERRRELVVALQNRAGPISDDELKQIAAIQQTISLSKMSSQISIASRALQARTPASGGFTHFRHLVDVAPFRLRRNSVLSTIALARFFEITSVDGRPGLFKSRLPKEQETEKRAVNRTKSAAKKHAAGSLVASEILLLVLPAPPRATSSRFASGRVFTLEARRFSARAGACGQSEELAKSSLSCANRR